MSPFSQPEFHASPPLEDEHVAELARTLHRRVTRHLQRKGRLPRESDVDDEASSSEPELLALISAASVQNGAASPTEGQPPVARLGRRSDVRAQFVPGSLCCDHEGFSLHARVLVPAGQRARLEYLCRYVARPAIATEPLSLAARQDFSRKRRPRGRRVEWSLDLSRLWGGGRHVAVSSAAPELAANDVNGVTDVCVHDFVSAETTQWSTDSPGGRGDLASNYPAISADGRLLAWESNATSLVAAERTTTWTRSCAHSKRGRRQRCIALPSRIRWVARRRLQRWEARV